MAKQSRIDVEAAREAGLQEHGIVAAAAIVASIAAPPPVATPAATPVATTAPRPNSRKRISTMCIFISSLASPSFLIDNVASL